MGCSGDGERSMINRVLLLAGFSVSHTGVWRTLELSEEGEPVSRLLILPQSLHSALLNNMQGLEKWPRRYNGLNDN